MYKTHRISISFALAILILTATFLSSCSLFKTDAEITGIKVNGEKLKDFDKTKLTYTVELSAGNTTPPQIEAVYHEAGYINPPTVVQAKTTDGVATVTSGSITYSVIFVLKEYDESYLHNTFRRLAVNNKLNITVLGGSSSCAETGMDPWQKDFSDLVKETFTAATVTLTDLSAKDARSDSFENIELASAPDLLLIDTTLGDQLAGLSPEESANALKELILKLNDAYPRCEIIAVLSTNAEYKTDSYPAKSAVTSMLDKLGVAYIDFAESFPRGIEMWDSYFTSDNVPTHASHELFAYSVFTFFYHETVELMPNPKEFRDVILNR